MVAGMSYAAPAAMEVLQSQAAEVEEVACSIDSSLSKEECSVVGVWS